MADAEHAAEMERQALRLAEDYAWMTDAAACQAEAERDLAFLLEAADHVQRGVAIRAALETAPPDFRATLLAALSAAFWAGDQNGANAAMVDY